MDCRLACSVAPACSRNQEFLVIARVVALEGDRALSASYDGTLRRRSARGRNGLLSELRKSRVDPRKDRSFSEL
jgi:hypothetical protein